MKHSKYYVTAAILFSTTLLCAISTASNEDARISARAQPTTQPATKHNFDVWEKEIAAFEEADRANPPAKGGILFIGSSTIRMWKTLAQDFAGHKVINRGFGGSEIVDSTHFAERIIFPYQPKMIFLRAGGNDIHAGRLPEEVANDFRDFVTKVREKLPEAEIVFIGWSPAPSRWTEKDKDEALNTMVRSMALHMPRVSYVDTWDISLDREGKPVKELFITDQLHFNTAGYKLLAERVRPYLPVK